MKIGADPEFSFQNSDGELVEASNVMSRVRSCFGLDGCDSIAELRPAPDFNPSQVVKTIYTDLRRGYMENPDIRDLYWKAGSIAEVSEGYSTGGHIHFGLRGAVRGLCRSNEDYYRELTRFLDTYLGQVGRLLEDPREAEARFGEGEYGHLGDYRSNAHGMEYRVLGSWLSSPRIAEGVLCLAQTVAYQHLWEKKHKIKRDISKIAPAHEYSDGDGDGDCICETDDAAENCDGDCNPPPSTPPEFRTAMRLHRKRFPELRKQIRTFKLYKKHKNAIEFLFTLIEKRKTWFPGKNVDMKAAWGITSIVSSSPGNLPKKALPPVRFNDIWERARAK